MSYAMDDDDWALIGLNILRADHQPTAPTKLAFVTPAVSVNENECASSFLDLTDGSGREVPATSATTINLSGAGYTFYSDPLCTNSISSFSLPAGPSIGAFYYTGTTSGAITAAASGMTSANQSETIASSSLGNGWSIVQQVGMWISPTPSTSSVRPLNRTTGAGHVLVAYCLAGGAGETFTVTDDAPGGGNTYVASPGGAVGTTVQLFYVLNSKAGATAVTVTGSLSLPYLACGLAEYANSGGVSPGIEAGTGTGGGDNITAGNTGGSTNFTASTGITTTVDGDLIFAQVHSYADDLSQAGPGFTSWDWSVEVGGEATTQNTAGSFSATAVITSAGADYTLEALAFKHP
jgi:hypothetical protein